MNETFLRYMHRTKTKIGLKTISTLSVMCLGQEDESMDRLSESIRGRIWVGRCLNSFRFDTPEYARCTDQIGECLMRKRAGAAAAGKICLRREIVSRVQ